MPSHHASPTKLPSSPLSSIFQTSPKPFIGRTKALSSDHLRLSAEMRFHQTSPLKSLDGSSSSSSSSKEIGLEMAAVVPKTPLRQHHKHSCSEAQKQLDLLRREFILNTSRLVMTTTPSSSGGMATGPPSVVTTYPYPYPVSPRLLPLHSPGPVTPLMLESDGDYLVPDARIPEHDLLGEKGQKQLMERLMREETKLRESRGGS